jgi:hypothetical protein
MGLYVRITVAGRFLRPRELRWRLSLHRLATPKGFEKTQAKQLHRKFINTRADIRVDSSGVEVVLPRRAHNPLLIEAGYDKLKVQVPWWGGKQLRFSFR